MNESEHFDVAVIGTGPAGQRAAIQAAKAGKRVIAIDRQRFVGGEAVQRGTIPSKTLREAVVHLTGVGQRAFYGQSYRVLSHITMADLTQRTAHVVQAEVEVVRDAFLRNDVEIAIGSAHFIDPHRLAINGEVSRRELSADRIILAVGSKPVRPSGVPFDDRQIADSDDILALGDIPKSLTVVGAGVVGCEYASVFAALGVPVTLIDGRTQLLEFVDSEISEALKFRMREDGITLRLGHNVASVELDSRGRVVAVLETGARVVSDTMMYAIGRQGATAALNREAADLAPDKRGRLAVNEHYQTECGAHLRGGRRHLRSGARSHRGGARQAGRPPRGRAGISPHFRAVADRHLHAAGDLASGED